MSHGYSLRSNAKGRRGRKSTGETDQVEGTCISTTSMGSTSSTRERRRRTLTDELPEGDSGIANLPNTNTPPNLPTTPTQNSIRRHTLTSSSAIRAADSGLPETWQDVQAARQREEEARRCASIRREQIVRVYEEELDSLRERIGVLREECEAKVERTRKKWARRWAFESGEVAVVVEEPKLKAKASGRVREAAQSMAWTGRRPEDRDPTANNTTSKEAGRGADGLAIPNTQGMHCHSLPGPSQALAANAQGQQFPEFPRVEGSGRTHHPQQLRRQQGQLMAVIPTDTSSVGQMETRGDNDERMDQC